MPNSKIISALTGLAAAAMLVIPAAGFAAQGDCGQPISDGSNPTATDASVTLRFAVGALSACSDFGPDCICDVNDSASTTASDALLVLRKAVGQPVTLDCGAACTTTTTISITTTTIGATTTTTLPPNGAPRCSSGEVIALVGGVIDSGWAGPGHNQDLISGARISAKAVRRCENLTTGARGAVCVQDSECAVGTERCLVACNCNNPQDSTCEITGPTHEQNCTITLDSCTSDGDCGISGGTCRRFFGGPLPLAAAGTPVCVTTYFAGDISGTADAFSGELVADFALRSRVHATNIDHPCPICDTGGTPAVGDTGTCVGDSQKTGLPCTVTSIHPEFGATSPDCPPQPAQNVSGIGLSVLFRGATTNTASKQATLICSDNPIHPNGQVGGFCADDVAVGVFDTPCSSNADCLHCTDDPTVGCTTNGDCGAGGACAAAPEQPIACGFYCHVGFCKGAGPQDPDQPCFADSDCTGGDTCVPGTGGATSANAPQQLPNDCSNTICGAESPEQCGSGDTLGVCDVKTYIPCTVDSQCTQQGAGTVCNFIPKPCFEAVISATGSPSPLGSFCSEQDPPTVCTTNADCGGTLCRDDTSVPGVVAIFPIPATASSAVNGAAGLTGPGRVSLSQILLACRCGDGTAGCDEECDDGNDIDGDACTNVCTLP